MKMNIKNLVVMIVIVWVFSASKGMAEEKKIQVVATIGQITDMAQIVGGDNVHVQGLMGPGVDPHLYKATESDVNKLAKADIIFYGGLYLEAKMDKIFKSMSRTKTTVAVSEAIEKDLLLDSISYAGHHDPHVWFDVPLWIKTVEAVAETYAEYDPANKEGYAERARQYISELETLHAYVSQRAHELPDAQRVLVTAHDAFRYFGRQYNFEVLGLQGISTETEAGTKDVIRLANFIAERKIKAIFIESSVSERNIKAVQDAVKAKGWDVKIGGELFSDAMGDEGTFEGTYKGMVTHNIDTIVDALR